MGGRGTGVIDNRERGRDVTGIRSSGSSPGALYPGGTGSASASARAASMGDALEPDEPPERLKNGALSIGGAISLPYSISGRGSLTSSTAVKGTVAP